MIISMPIDSDDISEAVLDSDLTTDDVIELVRDIATNSLDLDGLCRLHDELAQDIAELEDEDRQHRDVFTPERSDYIDYTEHARVLLYPDYTEHARVLLYPDFRGTW